ncbi:MAG: YfhO family protein [Bacteroidales bacterium]
MKNTSFKTLTPYLVAVFLFIIFSLVYFYPVLQGKKLEQGDITHFRGMAREVLDYREATGEEALWMNNMFSGMPAYMTSVKYKGNLMNYVDRAIGLGLPHPADYVFVYFLGFFILLLALRVNPWVSLIGAIGFAFSSYFFIIIEAGHNTKAAAIGYMAPVLAGIILAYRGKYLWGGVLTALFLALELRANHLQITYYLLLIVIFYGIFKFSEAIQEKSYMRFLKATGILIVAALLAVGTHITSLWVAADFSKYTTRGTSELTMDEQNKTSGLDRDYITDWSYGIRESFTLLVPDFAGGSSSGGLDEDSEVYDVLRKNNVPAGQARQFIRQLPLYWGPQPFTSGPVYVGAIVFFLFVFGIFIVNGRIKWWLLTITILSLFLAWGRHFMMFTDFFLDYIPGYDKFRAVSMTLVIAELSIPLLGFLALSRIFEKAVDKPFALKYLKYSLYIVGGILLIFIVYPALLYDAYSPADAQLKSQLARMGMPDQFIRSLLGALEADRLSILRADAFRSLIFAGLAFGLLWIWLAGKLKTSYALLLLGLFIFSDMWFVNKRYLNKDNFVRAARVEKPFQASAADAFILKDPDPNFRVLNLSVSTFNDARTPYFHKSIGGYHGAKLGRYQELIEYGISPEMQRLSTVLSRDPSQQRIQQALANLPVLNMLNTRYIIVDPQATPLINPHALGNAWFVHDHKIVENADEEIMAVTDFEPSKTAIIDRRFREYVRDLSFARDTNAQIRFLDYQPNHLKYETVSGVEQLAVFSEIYYEDGWNAYVDGEKVPHFRVNYVLRAMIVPAGEHTIEFRFEPVIYATGEKISLASSVLVILLFLGLAGRKLYKAYRRDP